jgi:hypothetical protein
MCYLGAHVEPLFSSFKSEVPTAETVTKGYTTLPQPWVTYKSPKSTPVQPTMCSNCTNLRHVLIFIAILAIFSPILMSVKSPLLRSAAQPALELTTHFLVYSAACFPVAGMAASYDILRKQPYRNMCVFCSLHAVATAIALRGLSCLHSTDLPSVGTARTVEFWAHCVHCVLLRPALWITGGDLDDFPFSKDARVQMWMLCMLCSAVLGLGVGFGLGRATVGGNITACKAEKHVVPSPFDLFLEKYNEKLKGLGHIATTQGHLPAKKTASLTDECVIQHRSLSPVEATFISACSLSGFWLCLTVIGAFATTTA